MTTTAKTTAADTILAIDLGKYKSVACVHDEASGTFRFPSFETTRSEMHRLLSRDRPTVVIIEACPPLTLPWSRAHYPVPLSNRNRSFPIPVILLTSQSMVQIRQPASTPQNSPSNPQ